jgi:hypothetical protein
VRVCLRNVYPGGLGQVAQAPGGGVPVHPGTAAAEQNRPPARGPIAWSIARPTAGGSGSGLSWCLCRIRAARGGRVLR